ncbi:MAG TPA: ABC transporter permease subunit [Phototrophicaceae bacterium]|nr:ABC transporter permease subunit [Phototrophicaceae bacterium]
MAEIIKSAARPSPSRWETLRTSKRWQTGLRQAISYIVLIVGAMFMLFPMLWMLSASLKPQWQIFTDPPIWIPQNWVQVKAGDTNRELSLYTVKVGDENRTVVQIGSRKYTTVIDAAQLHNLQTIPSSEVSDAVATTLDDGITLNVRNWTDNGTTKQVVALSRAGDNLVVVGLDDIRAAVSRMPLDVVNGSPPDHATIEGTNFQTRQVQIDGAAKSVISVGPQSELTVVASPNVVSQATIVPAESVSDAGYADVGQTQIHLIHTGDDQTNYVSLVSETWQPVINADELSAKAFIAPASKLGTMNPQTVNGVSVQVASYTPDKGSPYDVAVMVKGTTQSLVIPVSAVQSLRLGQLGGLASAHGATFGAIPYRIQDGFVDGAGTNSVALVGDPRDMALIVPQSAITDAFDVNPADLQRDMYAQLSFDGYTEALQTKIGDTYFPTFFRNSFILVILNTVGHLFSCVIVAYAFARLRAPGKGLLFLILLSTMMLPFPVTLVPVYEIFTKLGMIDTLWPLFLRSFFGNAFLIFMLRQFFLGIPQELEEAARIDGANVFQVIWNVIVPLSRPAIATVVIFTFWWTWNSFFEPYIYLSSPNLFPVSVGLNFFKENYGTIYYDRMIAASVLSMLPMLLIFFFAQRYFIEGIQLTGMKS